MELNRTIEAMQSFEASVMLNPRNTRAMLKKANLLFRYNRFEDAIKSYEKVIEIEPLNGVAYKNIAICLSRTGDESRAKDMMLKAKILLREIDQ